METQLSTKQLKGVRLYRFAGLAAVIAGTLYVIIQPLHPDDVLASVSSGRWLHVHLISMVMDALALIGVLGIFVKQTKKTGKVGLIGYMLFSLFFLMTFAFHFLETIVFPVLVKTSPAYIEGVLNMINSHPTDVDLGVLPAIYALTGIAYIIGGFLFGLATFRAKIFPRWSGGLLAIGSAATLLGAVTPHPLNRIFAVPVGIALIWMGIALYKNKAQSLDS